MDNTNQDAIRLHEVIEKGTSGVIILPVNPSLDATAAATALYLTLTKMGKNVAIACDTPPKHELTANDKVQQELSTSGDNLVVSFPYTDGAIDKVDYNIQGEVFNLVITPRSREHKLDPSQVKFSYAGGVIDFIITVDMPNLNSAGNVFHDNKNQFQGKTIINIDRHLVNDFFGSINIVNKTSSSTSELALRFIRDIHGELDRDSATNLYMGLTTATNNFGSYSVNADTFEAAAILLKAGAVKKQVKKPQPAPQPQQQQGQNQSFFPKRQPQPPRDREPQPVKQQIMTPQPSVDEAPRPIESVEQETQVKDSDDSSQDWLKPKIFRGTGLI